MKKEGLTMNELRVVEVYTVNGWQEVEMSDLRVGDRFRMFEPNGDPVVNRNDGTSEWVVQTPPRVGEYGVYEVNIYEGISG